MWRPRPRLVPAGDASAVCGSDLVAILGTGPVGLLSAISAILKGAAIVRVVDRSAARPAMAARPGADGAVDAVPVSHALGRRGAVVKPGLKAA